MIGRMKLKVDLITMHAKNGNNNTAKELGCIIGKSGFK